MNFAQLLSNAGVASGAMRSAEENERVAQENQLKIEEQNRYAKLKRDAAALQFGTDQQAAAQPASNFNLGAALANLRANLRIGPPIDQEYIDVPAPAAAPVARTESVYVPPQLPAAGETVPVSDADAFKAMSPTERFRRLQIENDRRLLSRIDTGIAAPPAAAFDIAALPYTVGGKLLEKGLNAIDFARAGRAVGLYGPDITSVEIPGTNSITPFTDRLRQSDIENQPLTEEQYLAQLRTNEGIKKAAGVPVDPKVDKVLGTHTATLSKLIQKDGQQLTALAPRLETLINRADALGVDPIAAMAIYGIESGFGGSNVASVKGAKGSMQVTDATFTGMKTWYTDKTNIAKYKISPELTAVANQLRRGNPQSELDAGLLRLKYNELIGVPQNLWGAAYQTNAEKVLAAKRPLNITDGNLTNASYNDVYIGLYNHIATNFGSALAFEPNTTVVGVNTANAPAPVAPAPAPAAAPAPVAAAPAPAPAAAAAPVAPPLPAPAAPPTAAAPAAPAPAVVAAADSLAPDEKLVVPPAPTKVEIRGKSELYLANPESIPYEQQRIQKVAQEQMGLLQEQGRLLTNQRNERAQLATLYQRSGTDVGLKQAASLRGDIEKLDGDMLTLRGATITLRQKVEESETYLQGMQGIEDFSTANDPRRLSAVWSLYAGVPIGIQPRSDGTFNIIVNGVRTKSGVSERDITNTARLAFDQAYRQQSATAGAAMNKFMSEERYKTTLKIQEGNASELAKMIKDIAIENVKGNSALALEWAKANYGYDIKPTGSGDGTVIIKPPNSQPYIFNPTGRTIEIDGIKVQSNAAQLISGLPIAAQQRLNAVR